MQESPAHVLSLAQLGFIEPFQLASSIDVTIPTLNNWRAAGKGPPFTKVHGNKIVYPVDGVKKWLLDRTVRPEQAPTLINPRKRGRGVPS